MPSPSPLQPDCCYHIFNRGVNRQNLFFEQRNYTYFLKLYAHYIEPVADTYAYCLLPNHFHLLIRVKTETEQRQYHETVTVLAKSPQGETFKVLSASQAFSNLFNAYTKAVNTSYQRSGSLFEHPFHRIQVTTEDYFAQLVVYIHQNPQRHGLLDDFRDWPYSSYPALLSSQPTRLKREIVMDWLGGRTQLAAAHQRATYDPQLKPLLLDDW